MDISVSQLNHRLALQLPAELPLGLVFVSGTAVHVSRGKTGRDRDNGPSLASFDLVQEEHRLRCRLSAREADRVAVEEGDQLRVGGHLVFDPHRAEYYLLARDAEVIGDGGVGDTTVAVDGLKLDPHSLVQDEALAAALAGIKRRATTAQQAPVGLPDWVQKIAPLELQETESREREAEVAVPASPAEPSRRDQLLLNEALVQFLSEIMESDEEVELTPEMLSQYTAVPPAPEKEEMVEAKSMPEPDAGPVEDEESPAPVQPYAMVAEAPTPTSTPPTFEPQPAPAYHQTDWLVVVLITASIIFTLALIVTIIILAIG